MYEYSIVISLNICLLFTAQVCSVQSRNRMTCPVPPLPQSSQTTGDDADDNDQALAEFHIGFILDGLPTYRCV